MILDAQLVEALAIEFLRKRGENYIIGSLLPGDTATQLGSASNKFSDLYVQNLHASSIVSGGSSTDTVDGFHASATPKPNTLLALDNRGYFPDAALGNVILKTGGLLTGNLNVSAGILLDGVDLNLFKAEFDSHRALGAAQAHNGLGPHDHTSPNQGGDLTQYANSDGSGTRPAFAAMRLRRTLVAGRGLTGGGLFDNDLRLDVNPGNGLSIASTGAVELSTPGTLSASSQNNSAGNHTHFINASSDVASESLLKSSSLGGLRLQRFAVGTATVPSVGGIAASGEIHGNRIVSDQDAFVGNDLSVGTSVLNTAKTRSAVYINREASNPSLAGALTVRPGAASQRGVVIQGKAGQENTAPLLSVADSSGQDVFIVRPDGMLESGNPAFVSGLRGWRITSEGDAEFRNLTARGELHTSVFVANEMHATGGTMAVMTTGVIDSPIQADDNLLDSTFNLIVSGDPNLPGACTFSLNDVLRVKLITGLKEN